MNRESKCYYSVNHGHGKKFCWSMDVGSQRERGRDTSPPDDPANRWLKQKTIKRPAAAAATRVQVVYYLSRNGLLQHPHFMELTLLPNHPLRLKDVFDRLMVLRGSGMPLQYSWSSKRNYKSSYVWHDLALEDILRPAEGGGEYVLKGSELVHGCSERFQRLNVTSNKQATTLQLPEPNCSHHKPKHKALNCAPRTQKEPEEYEERARSCTNTTSTTTHPGTLVAPEVYPPKNSMITKKARTRTLAPTQQREEE